MQLQSPVVPAEIIDLSALQIDEYFMRLAITQSNKPEPTESAFNVGAILVKNNRVFSTGYSREISGNTHAEQCCLLKLSSIGTASGATLYSTMEPCGLRLSGNVCCATLIINAKISRVVIGLLEPIHFVGVAVGNQMLIDAGIEVVRLSGFEEECQRPNKHLESQKRKCS
jgi:pyrimidine deaminase RibD-like protein